MGKSDAFKIRFSGLKIGEHRFDLVADNAFFDKPEYTRIPKGEVNVALLLQRKPTHMELNFDLNGWVDEQCDRCAIAYRQALSGSYTVFVKFGDDFDEPDDNLIVIPREAHELDVSHMVYEFMGLSIPQKLVPCEQSGDTSMCDQEVLRMLESQKAGTGKDSAMWSAMNEIKDQLKDN